MAQPKVRSLMWEIAAEIDHLPRVAMREFLPVLREAERELARDLRAWLQSAKNGEERFTAQQLRLALLQVRKAKGRIEELEPALSNTLLNSAERSGSLATRHVLKALVEMAPRFSHSLNPVPLVPAITIGHGRNSLIKRFAACGRRYSEAVFDDIRKQLSIGLVRGETFHQLTTRLARLGGPRGLVPLSISRKTGEILSEEHIAEGLFTRYRHWANRVVRTEVLHTYNSQASEAIEEVAKEDPDIRKRWDATLDRRVCAMCRDLDHTVVKVNENFPGGIDHPPAHPNCRCSVVAWRSDWSEAGAVKFS